MTWPPSHLTFDMPHSCSQLLETLVDQIGAAFQVLLVVERDCFVVNVPEDAKLSVGNYRTAGQIRGLSVGTGFF